MRTDVPFEVICETFRDVFANDSSVKELKDELKEQVASYSSDSKLRMSALASRLEISEKDLNKAYAYWKEKQTAEGDVSVDYFSLVDTINKETN